MIVASNSRIALRRTVPDDRMRIYHWIARNDLAQTMTGNAPVFEPRVPTFDEFRARHPEHCFNGRRPLAGRALIVSNGVEDVGFLAYREVDLINDVVELDAWLAARRFQGRGYGSDAIALACDWLQAEFGVNGFLLRTSLRNVHALRAARRAGFRQVDGDAGELRTQLHLAPGDYADEVLLLRTLPSRPATLATDDMRTYVFFDSELTHRRAPSLLSVGAVATDATAFYCELKDWSREQASDFVRNEVLPLLDGDAVPLAMAREAFGAWLAERGRDRPITIVGRSGYHRQSLAWLLGSEDLPANVFWQHAPLADEHLDEVARTLGLRRHHALDDARALRHALYTLVR